MIKKSLQVRYLWICRWAFSSMFPGHDTMFIGRGCGTKGWDFAGINERKWRCLEFEKRRMWVEGWGQISKAHGLHWHWNGHSITPLPPGTSCLLLPHCPLSLAWILYFCIYWRHYPVRVAPLFIFWDIIW